MTTTAHDLAARISTPHAITNDQAADLLTAASIRDMLNGRGGITLPDAMREQYREQLVAVEAKIPTGLACVAWNEAATRHPKDTLSNAIFAWLRGQNIAT